MHIGHQYSKEGETVGYSVPLLKDIHTCKTVNLTYRLHFQAILVHVFMLLFFFLGGGHKIQQFGILIFFFTDHGLQFW